MNILAKITLSGMCLISCTLCPMDVKRLADQELEEQPAKRVHYEGENAAKLEDDWVIRVPDEYKTIYFKELYSRIMNEWDRRPSIEDISKHPLTPALIKDIKLILRSDEDISTEDLRKAIIESFKCDNSVVDSIAEDLDSYTEGVYFLAYIIKKWDKDNLMVFPEDFFEKWISIYGVEHCGNSQRFSFMCYERFSFRDQAHLTRLFDLISLYLQTPNLKKCTEDIADLYYWLAEYDLQQDEKETLYEKKREGLDRLAKALIDVEGNLEQLLSDNSGTNIEDLAVNQEIAFIVALRNGLSVTSFNLHYVIRACRGISNNSMQKVGLIMKTIARHAVVHPEIPNSNTLASYRKHLITVLSVLKQYCPAMPKDMRARLLGEAELGYQVAVTWIASKKIKESLTSVDYLRLLVSEGVLTRKGGAHYLMWAKLNKLSRLLVPEGRNLKKEFAKHFETHNETYDANELSLLDHTLVEKNFGQLVMESIKEIGYA